MRPELLIAVPLEARPQLLLLASTLEDQRRLLLELARRDIASEIAIAVNALLDALDDRGEWAA